MTEQRTVPDPATGHPCSRIVVFAREPLLGKVKSRLAIEIGAQEALVVYRAMLARLGQLLAQAQIAAWDLWVTSNCYNKDFVSICNKKIYIFRMGKTWVREWMLPSGRLCRRRMLKASFL